MTRRLLGVAAPVLLGAVSTGMVQDAPTGGAALDAKQALLDVFAHYRAMERYAGVFKAHADIKIKGDNQMFAEMMAGQTDQTFTIRFARPNRLFFDSDQVVAVSDGRTLAIGYPMMLQYVEQESPANLTVENVPMVSAFMGGGGPTLLDPLSMLLQDEKAAHGFLAMLQAPEATRIEVGGQPRIHVTAVAPSDIMPMGITDGDIALPVEIWIDPERQLVTRYHVDVTEPTNRMMKDAAEAQPQAMAFGSIEFERMVTIVTVDDQQVNPELAPDQFAFDWGAAGYAKGDPAELGGLLGTATSPLLGMEAPEIESETLAGEPFKLSDLRGSVVVLDFWATWCAPCVQAIPKVQQLHEHFAGQPVRVVGVNQDHHDHGTFDHVKRFLERKKITFTQVGDSSRGIGQTFEVSGIPAMVLIDPTGVIQAVHVGFAPNEEKALIDEIEGLLKGESLLTDEERRQAEEQREASREVRELEAREDTGRTAPGNLEDVAPKRLVEGEVLPGVLHGYGAVEIDIDGDGREELLAPSRRANYEIIRGDGTVEPLRLQGIPRQLAGTVKAIRIDDQTRLAVIVQLAGMNEIGVLLGVWRADGTRVWSSRIDLHASTSAMPLLEAADLTGDGRPEIIAAISTSEYDYSDQSPSGFAAPKNRKAYLAVYDADGTLLAQRHVGQSIEGLSAVERETRAAALYVITGAKAQRFELDLGAAATPADR